MNFRTRRRPDDVELNFVPLIDVLVVLLIFLMVTTSFNRLGQLKVDLPQAAVEGAPAKSRQIELAISTEGKYAVDGVPLAGDTPAALTTALRQAAAGHAEPILVLSVDRLTPHERVVAAMVAAREAGLENLTFAVETAGTQP